VNLPIPAVLRPSRSVPVTRWRADSRWRARPMTYVVLVAGLWLFGTGEALIVDAGLGNGPWTVLAQGLAVRTELSIGVTTFIISILVLLLWIPLRVKPGLGTLANAVVIATALQVMMVVLPQPRGFVWQLVMVLGGIAAIGIGSGLYLTTNLGPGPRDGWMTGLHLRTGWPIPGVRLGIEVTVLALGWLLGGVIGLGTVLFAVLIGPFVGYGLALVGAVAGAKTTVAQDAEPELEA